MFVRGEGDQYPPIGKRGHPPLQAFLGPGCSGTNTRTHFTQFLLSLFGGDMDVLGDAFRSRFFGTHGFYFIATRTPESPAPANRDQTESVAVNCAAEHRKPCFGVSPLLVPQVCPMLLALTRVHYFRRRFWPASIIRLPTDRYPQKSNC